MASNKKTYLIEFTDGTQIVCGNNYKTWLLHAAEFAWSKYSGGHPHSELLKSVSVSDTKFVDDGGLKYAVPKSYDEVIDEVNKKENKKYIPFEDIKFTESKTDTLKLEKELKKWDLI